MSVEPARQRLVLVDANVVLRYLLRDTPGRPELMENSRLIIEGERSIALTEGTIGEVAYVLLKVYGYPRDATVDALISLIRRHNVRLHGLDKGVVTQALLLCRPSGRVSFADAMLWAVARSAGDDSLVYSHDKRFPSEGIEIRREP